MGRKAKQPVNQDTDNQEPIKKDERIILFQDTPKIEELKTKLNEILPFAEKVVKAYHNLPFATDSAGYYDILANTAENAKTHLRNTLPDKMDIAGVTLNKAKVLQLGLIEVDGMAEFNKVLDEFTTASGISFQQYFKHEGKAVVIDPVVWKKFEDSHTIAAITANEIELFNKWQNFLTNINEFAAFIKEHGIMILPVPLGPVIIGLIARLDKENKLIINKDAFSMLTKKIRNKIN